MATIGAGAVTFIVGPVTGAAVGASSEVVAISIAIGVLKSIVVMNATPMLAKPLGLNNPKVRHDLRRFDGNDFWRGLRALPLLTSALFLTVL